MTDQIRLTVLTAEQISSPAEWEILSSEGPLIITRAAVRDGLIDIKKLKDDPRWEQDFITDNWIRFSEEVAASRAAAEAGLPAQQDAAEIALGVALLDLESELPHQERGPRYTAIGGVGAYQEICSWDMGVESNHYTSGEAIREWRERLLASVRSCKGDTLWWREPPEIKGAVRGLDNGATWYVYSRLLIGNAADTIIERIRRGEISPRVEMIADNVLAMKQLEDIGYTYDAASNEWTRPGWTYDVSMDQWHPLPRENRATGVRV